MAGQGGSSVIQLFCPACENVVWVEEADAEEPVFCPECSQAIHASGKRKARPLTSPTDRSVPRPATTGSHVVPASEARPPTAFEPLPPCDEGIEDAQLDEEGEALEGDGEFRVPWP